MLDTRINQKSNPDSSEKFIHKVAVNDYPAQLSGAQWGDHSSPLTLTTDTPPEKICTLSYTNTFGNPEWQNPLTNLLENLRSQEVNVEGLGMVLRFMNNLIDHAYSISPEESVLLSRLQNRDKYQCKFIGIS